MTTLSFPSATFPAPPQVHLDVPEGWEPVHVPGAALAVMRPEPSNVFRPNIVVTLLDGADGTDPHAALEAATQRVREHRDAEIGEVREATVSGVDFIGRNTSFVDEQAGTIAQMHLFGAVASGPEGHRTLIQLTATFGAAHAAEDATVVHQIIKSMTITPDV